MPDPIVNHLRAIRNHTGSDTPLRFRLGGNSMDSATYKSDQAEMLIFTNPEANVNDQPVDFGPVLWVRACSCALRSLANCACRA